MKRFLAILLALAMVLSFAACGQTSESGEETAAEVETEEEVAEAAVPYIDTIDLTGNIYADEDNWAYYNDGDFDVDVFFLCPTMTYGSTSSYNLNIDNPMMRGSMLGGIKKKIGVFSESCNVWAPYYRQVNLIAYRTQSGNTASYFATAYNDVKAAFDYYLTHSDRNRPFVLAGHSQGSDMLVRLMKDIFDDEELQDRLVCAYLIGWDMTPTRIYGKEDIFKPAQGEDDYGVFVSYNCESVDVQESSLVGRTATTYSINPLNWKTDSTVADKSLHLGACFTTTSGTIESEIPNFTSAYLQETRGALKCPDVVVEDYTSSSFADGVFHTNDYSFFYRNLQQNVAVRIAAYKAAH